VSTADTLSPSSAAGL